MCKYIFFHYKMNLMNRSVPISEELLIFQIFPEIRHIAWNESPIFSEFLLNICLKFTCIFKKSDRPYSIYLNTFSYYYSCIKVFYVRLWDIANCKNIFCTRKFEVRKKIYNRNSTQGSILFYYYYYYYMKCFLEFYFSD